MTELRVKTVSGWSMAERNRREAEIRALDLRLNGPSFETVRLMKNTSRRRDPEKARARAEAMKKVRDSEPIDDGEIAWGVGSKLVITYNCLYLVDIIRQIMRTPSLCDRHYRTLKESLRTNKFEAITRFCVARMGEISRRKNEEGMEPFIEMEAIGRDGVLHKFILPISFLDKSKVASKESLLRNRP